MQTRAGRSLGCPQLGRSSRTALSLLVGLLLAPAWGQESSGLETAHVYKADGTLHCDSTEGIPLDTMAQELIVDGIFVYARRQGHDGREGIAVCGDPTGSINVYEIRASDLPRALELGFERLDPSATDDR